MNAAEAGLSAGVKDGSTEVPSRSAVAVGEEDGKKISGGEQAREGFVAVDIRGGVCGSRPEQEVPNVCRICHLSSDLVGSAAEGWEHIQIGCGCIGELGIAHRRCAEAWFRVKGSRICEICGLVAKNIVGKEDWSFMEVWHENRRPENNRNSPERGCCWTSQKFCSFLVSFIVIAFILQWYFRISFSW
ncbi:hypothetical protein AXF42_Ash015747 [Apostasia shenzhenica]|uniref:RING-CH-type domain-containing protein n=1 Tax=Apostasia shenzhenica TaxID=1088818 RepID=A0A2H9ZU89_9ASPA|nr:hypothetical protein AXF42_Ash015747 [Apostasia shenzhenica]